MSERESKIEKLVEDQIKWDAENMRGSNPEAIREHLQELSDDELDNALAMRGQSTANPTPVNKSVADAASEPIGYPCSRCDVSYDNAPELRVHILKSHASEQGAEQVGGIIIPQHPPTDVAAMKSQT